MHRWNLHAAKPHEDWSESESGLPAHVGWTRMSRHINKKVNFHSPDFQFGE
jgi:hypothetical protein